MYKTYIISGAVFAFIAVILGAAGAHVLEADIHSVELNRYETALKYQFYHALALIFCGVLLVNFKHNNWLKWSGNCFIAGILLFSFSLYLLVITGNDFFASITPFGGISFIAAWLFMIIGTLKIKI